MSEWSSIQEMAVNLQQQILNIVEMCCILSTQVKLHEQSSHALLLCYIRH